LIGLREIGQNSASVAEFFAIDGPEIILPLPQKMRGLT